MPISVCILVNKWHPKLVATLDSYNNCCAEILLGANGGFDATAYPVLQKYPQLKIIDLTWEGYGKTKNKLATYAKNEWILSVDADEVADDTLSEALQKIKLQNSKTIFAFQMCHYIGEKPVRHGSWSAGKRKFLRLYNRTHTQWDEAAVHESIQVKPDSEIQLLAGKINHYTVENYPQFLEKNKHYAALSVQKYQSQNKSVFPGKSFISAAFSFIKNYFFRLGFLDGKAGWQIAKGTTLYTYWKYHWLRNKKVTEKRLP